MATYSASSGRYTTTLTITQGTQNITTNTSVINWNLTLVSDGGVLYHTNVTCPWSVKINGTTVDSGYFSYSLSGGTTTIINKSGSTTVTHNSDGTLSVEVIGYTDMDNTPYVYPMTASGTFTLDTIPRTADLSLSTTSLKITSASGTITANITSKSTAIYNKLTWSGVLSGNAQMGNATTSRSFNVTDILNAMPSSTSGTLTVRVDSYNNSSYSGTPIGSNTVSCAITIDTTQIKPSFTANGSIGVNTSPISGYAVAGYSKLAVTGFSVKAGYGATALTITSTISTGSMADTRKTGTSPMTSQSMVSNVLPSSASNYSVKIYILVTDGRGASVQKEYSWTTVYGYTKPTASLRAYRVNSDSSTTEDGAGGYVYIATLTSDVGASINGQNSIQTATTSQTGMDGASTFAFHEHRTLAITSSATLTYTVTDKVGGTTTARVIIGNATYPLILRDNKSGVVGAGFGVFPQTGEVNYALPLASETGQTKLVLCNVTNADCVAQDSSLTSSSSNEAWYQALLKAICVKYPNKSACIFKGSFSPNSFRSYEVFIYNTSVVSSGLPQYSYGTMYNYGTGDNSPCPFGTSNYVFYYFGGLNVRHAVTADSATSATNATNATNATSANNSVYCAVPRTAHDYGQDFAQNKMRVLEYQGDASSGPSAHYYHVFNTMGPDTAYATQFALGMTTRGMYYRNYFGGNWWAWNRVPLEHQRIWTGSLLGGNTVSINMSAYARIRVFVQSWGVNQIFEIDLQNEPNAGKIDSGYVYTGGALTPMYGAAGNTGSMEYHVTTCKVNSAKNTLWFSQAGYSVAGGSFTNRNNNSQYYVYRVDGIL